LGPDIDFYCDEKAIVKNLYFKHLITTVNALFGLNLIALDRTYNQVYAPACVKKVRNIGRVDRSFCPDTATYDRAEGATTPETLRQKDRPY